MPLIYEDYNPDLFDDIAEPLHSPERFGGVYGGLSPFDLPNQVELEKVGAKHCIFHFHYVDKEPVEKHTREVPGTGIHVRLGKESKKIVYVVVPTAAIVSTDTPITFDDRLALSWCKGEPERVATSARRNAWVVTKILGSFPDQFRRVLVDVINASQSDRT